MQRFSLSLSCFLLFTHLCLAQQRTDKELVLQTFHSGYKIIDFDIDQAGTKLISVGDDRTILFYDLSMQLIYKRISLADSVKCEHVAIDSASRRVATLENAKIVFRSIQNGETIKEVKLKPILDSLKLNDIDRFFFETVTEENLVMICATKNSTGFMPTDFVLLGFDLSSGQLKKVSPTIPKYGQTNDFKWVGGRLYVLRSAKGLSIIDTKTGEEKIIWQAKKDDETTASMQIANKQIWLLTDKQLLLIDEDNYQVIKSYGQQLGENRILARQHAFTVDEEGNAYQYNSNTQKLEVYSKLAKEPFNAAPDVYLPTKLKSINSKKYLAIADDSKLSILDYKQKVLLLQKDNSLTKLENWQFFKPGNAYVAIPYHNSFLKIDFTAGVVSRQTFTDLNFAGNEQLIDLPKSKLVAASNGLYVKFLEAKTNVFKFGISVPKMIFVNQEDNQLNYGSSYGPTNVFFSEDEKIMISPKNLDRSILVWDITSRKLLREIALEPLKKAREGTKQVIQHVTFQSTQKLVYVETAENYGGNDEVIVADAITGKIIYHQNLGNLTANQGTFFPKTRKVITAGKMYRETNIVDLNTMQVETIPMQMKNPVVSQDEQLVFFIDGESIYSYHFATKVKTLLGEQPGVRNLVLDAATNLLIATDRNNNTQVWDSRTGKLRCTLFLLVPKNKTEQPAYVFVSPDFYYMGGGNYSNLIVMRENDGIVPLEVFDRVYNRPDILLTAIGASMPELIEQLKKATARRTKILPAVPVKNFAASIRNKANFPMQIAQRDITIHCGAVGAENPLATYQIWLNGVALFKEKKQFVASKTAVLETIALTEATNRIELAFWDNKLNESRHDLLSINLEKPPVPSLWLVALGVSQYQNADFNLRFARKDVENVAEFLKSAQTFKKVNVLQLADQQVAKEAFGGIEQFLSAAKPEDIVMVFYAGHGLLDAQMNYYLASYQMDFANAATNGIPIQLFEKVMYSTAARKKLLMIDACHSGLVEEPFTLGAGNPKDHVTQNQRGGGVINNQKGGINAEALQSAFLNLDKGDGITIISASGGSEFAYEDGKIGNGLFTYSFLEGVKTGKADLNKNEQISLSEIKTYVEDRVVELSNGKQRPTNRKWNSYLDFPLWHAADRIDQQFFRAVTSNDTTGIRKFLNAGYAIDLTDESTGYSPLHFAARESRLTSLKFLITNGAALEKKSSLALTPLYLAVFNNHIVAAYVLIIAGAKVKGEEFFYLDKGKMTLMQIANVKNNSRLATMLKDEEDLRAKHKTFITLVQDIYNGNIEAFKNKLADGKVDLNFVRADQGVALIHYAVGQQKLEFVDYLIEKGALINNIPYCAINPLHMAAYTGNEIIAQRLLKAGADKTAKDENGKKPADYVPATNTALKALLQ